MGMEPERAAPSAPRVRRILAVSDIVEPQLYNARLPDWIGPLDFILSCGDLPAVYLDFLITCLNVPCYHVIGNHCYAPHGPQGRDLCEPHAYPGVTNLHGRVVQAGGLTLAGVAGSPWYNGGPHQYTEWQTAWTLRRLMPGLVANYARSGRYLDILVTHAPPRGIHDDTDVTHRGFAAFLPFLRRFRPTYMVHGHTHRYINTLPFRTNYGATTVINAYGHRILEVPVPTGRRNRSTPADGP